MKPDADNEEYDVIVVGSGAAGSWAAKDLSQGGLRVLMMDAGRNIEPAVDFPDPKPDNPIFSRIGAALRGQHIQVRSISFGSTTKRFYVDDRQNPYEAPAERPFLWLRGRQVGGRLHTWGRSALRMSDAEFQKPVDGADTGWPLRHADLSPYYERVEHTLGVHGNKDGLSNLPDGAFIEPHEINPAERLMTARLLERTGLQLICNRVVKYDPVRTPLPIRLGLETGRLTIQPNAVVSRIVVDEQTGMAAGVGYVDRLSKQYREVKARTVVLCASALESVRILLNSACRRHPGGIGGDSNLLGRYVCDHVMFGQGGPLSAEYLDALKQANYEPPSRDPYDFGVYSLYLPNFCGTWGEQPDFRGGYGMQCGCSESNWFALGFGEMQPRFENHVSLSQRKTDAWGIPAVRIDVGHSEEEDRMVAHMAGSMESLADEAGLPRRLGGEKAPRFYHRLIVSALKRRLFSENRAFWPGSSIHETGGARMGTKPDNSVVNEFCQVWSVPNVFVTDGACFVSSGYQNHTLTILAVTARACDYIVREYSKQLR